MARCSFCKHAMEPGTGTLYVKTDGTLLNFCSMKCEKNLLKLKRTPRYTRWTKAFEKGEGQGAHAKPAAPVAKPQEKPAAPGPKPAAPAPAAKPAVKPGEKK